MAACVKKHIKKAVLATFTTCPGCGLNKAQLVAKMEPMFQVKPGLRQHGFVNVDHIRPRSKGGSNHFSNLQAMCLLCNFKKADKASL